MSSSVNPPPRPGGLGVPRAPRELSLDREALRSLAALADARSARDPPEAIRSLVGFTDKAKFKTEIPQGVIRVSELVEYLKDQAEVVMSQNRVQFCVGRLETACLAISGETDIARIQSVERRYGGAT